MTKTKTIGKSRPAASTRRTWVQTEREAHEAWTRLIHEAPTAAMLMHVLVANMDASSNAVVASQSTLGELLATASGHAQPVHRNTVRRALATLERERWIEIVRIGGKGGALAYVVNSRVAWSRSRDAMRYAAFAARVVASEAEQTAPIDGREPLRQVPTLLRGEQQLPAGPGEPPPSQPSLPGMEADLPAIRSDEQGRRWQLDRETGELQQVMDLETDQDPE